MTNKLIGVALFAILLTFAPLAAAEGRVLSWQGRHHLGHRLTPGS